MLNDQDRIFTNIYGLRDKSLRGAMSRGHWDGTKQILEKGRDWIINEMKASGLRGRGGAGFPTGMKWQFVLKDTPQPKYICCNADESEPGTFKDREILRQLPHLVIEGMLLGMFVVGAGEGIIFVRHEYGPEEDALRAELREARERGHLSGDRDIEIFTSPGRR